MTDRGRHWIVDGMNVVGSRPDGWWQDPPAAMERLVELLTAFARAEAGPVTVVFDGARKEPVAHAGGRDVTVVFAAEVGAAEADDVVVDLAADAPDGVRVVTSDRGLTRRLPDGVEVVGAGGFRDRLEDLGSRD